MYPVLADVVQRLRLADGRCAVGWDNAERENVTRCSGTISETEAKVLANSPSIPNQSDSTDGGQTAAMAHRPLVDMTAPVEVKISATTMLF